MDERSPVTVARRFSPSGRVTAVERHPGGHIHETWIVAGPSGDGLVLQRLNDAVFPDCVQMMDNVLRVTTHLGRRGRRTVSVARTAEGAALVYDREGRPWRAFERIPGAVSRAVADEPATAHQIGRALGRFLVDVQDVPGPALIEPIPGFKDLERRRRDFEFIVELDPYGRASSCPSEIEDVRHYHRLLRQLGSAHLDVRVVHNDAKAANVLLDESTGEALCVIDLDTVAPGTVLFDVGDLLRSATVTSSEDATDVAGIAVRDDLLVAALTGYLAEAGELLTDDEREALPLGGPLMAYENAMRFLTDHLAGDSYFRIERPRHNLDRARAQIRVLKALDRAGGRVAEVVASG